MEHLCSVQILPLVKKRALSNDKIGAMATNSCAFSFSASLKLIDMRTEVVFFLNGQRHAVDSSGAALVLSDYLRLVCGLPGTKVVCAEGDCGACTVVCARFAPAGSSRHHRDPKTQAEAQATSNAKKQGRVEFRAINSCIVLIAQLDGCSVVTIEGLNTPSLNTPSPKTPDPQPDPSRTEIQEKLFCSHAAQCGYCTPGIAMALAGAVEKLTPQSQKLSEQDAKNALTGNLCRCTGYAPIISAAQAIDIHQALTPSLHERYGTEKIAAALRRVCSQPCWLKPTVEADFEFYAPLTLKAACAYLKKNPSAQIIAAGTDLGVLRNKRKQVLKKLMSLHLIKNSTRTELKRKKELLVGCNATIDDFRSSLKQALPEFAAYLDLFASPQIRNVATVIGNLANASPIGDLAPPLLVLNAKLEIATDKKPRLLDLSDFFLGYRKTALKKGQLISGLKFEIPGQGQIFKLYKVSQRKDLDISTINAAFCVQLAKERSGLMIGEARIAYGGVAAIPLRLYKLERWLSGRQILPQSLQPTIDSAIELLQSEITPISDLRASAAYRRVVAENLLRRYLHHLFAASLDGSVKKSRDLESPHELS